VVFKSLNGSIRIEPLADQPACSGLNPDCWESRTLEQGKDVKWTLTAPRLTQLSPLTDPVPIDVNWIVYNIETKKHLRASKTASVLRIQLKTFEPSEVERRGSPADSSSAGSADSLFVRFFNFSPPEGPKFFPY